MRSTLTRTFIFLWICLIFVMAGFGFVARDAYDQGASNLTERGVHETQELCHELLDQFEKGKKDSVFRKGRDQEYLAVLLQIILSRSEGIEGGVWSTRTGFESYAFPTYEGGGSKTDVPQAERESIAFLADESIRLQHLKTKVLKGRRQALVLSTCPISDAPAFRALWTMTRVPLVPEASHRNLILGIEILALFIVGIGIGLAFFLSTWLRELSQIESQLNQENDGKFKPLIEGKSADLNRITRAINQLNLRKQNVDQQLKRSERLSELGKMASVIAHEIRNPLGTVRLKLENALIDPVHRLPGAAQVSFDQIERIERLVQMLLDASKPLQLTAKTVELETWFHESFSTIEKLRAEKKIGLQLDFQCKTWSFDEFHFRRVIENLYANAVSFAPNGSDIRITVFARDERLHWLVSDSGAGVDSEKTDSLFEAYVSTRKGGTGLGLVLSKEIVEAHGGTLSYARKQQWSQFEVEIPWLKS